MDIIIGSVMTFVGLSVAGLRVYAIMSSSKQSPSNRLTTFVCTPCPGHRDELPEHSLLRVRITLEEKTEFRIRYGNQSRQVRVASSISTGSIHKLHLVEKARAALKHFTLYQAERITRVNRIKTATANKKKPPEQLIEESQDTVCQLCASKDCMSFSPRQLISDLFVETKLIDEHSRSDRVIGQSLYHLSTCGSFWVWWSECEEMLVWQALLVHPDVSTLLVWFEWHQVLHMIRTGVVEEMVGYLQGQELGAGAMLLHPRSVDTPEFLRPYVFDSPYDTLCRIGSGDVDTFIASTINWITSDTDLDPSGEWVRFVCTYACATMEDGIMKNTIRLCIDGKIVHPGTGCTLYTAGSVVAVRALFTKIIAKHCAVKRIPLGVEIEAHLLRIYTPIGLGSEVAVRSNNLLYAADLCTELAKRSCAPEELAVPFTVDRQSQAWVTLSPHQKDCVELMMMCSVLIGDGYAGTGKTHLLALATCWVLLLCKITVVYVCQTKQGCSSFRVLIHKMTTTFKTTIDMKRLKCRTFASLDVFAQHNPKGVYALGMKESLTCTTVMIFDEVAKVAIKQLADFLRKCLPGSCAIWMFGGSDQPSMTGDPLRGLNAVENRNCPHPECPVRVEQHEQQNAYADVEDDDGQPAVSQDSIVVRTCNCDVWRVTTCSTGKKSQRATKGITKYLELLQGGDGDTEILTHGDPDVDPHNRNSPAWNLCTGTWDDIGRSVQSIAEWERDSCLKIVTMLGVVWLTVSRRCMVMTTRRVEQTYCTTMMNKVVQPLSIGCLVRAISAAPLEHVLITNTAGQLWPEFTVVPIPVDYNALAREYMGMGDDIVEQEEKEEEEKEEEKEDDAVVPGRPTRENLQPWMQGIVVYVCDKFVVIGLTSGYIRVRGRVVDNFMSIQVGTVAVNQGAESDFVLNVASPYPGSPSNASPHGLTVSASRARMCFKQYLPPTNKPHDMYPIFAENGDALGYVGNVMRDNYCPPRTALAAIADFTPSQLTRANQLLSNWSSSVQIPVTVPIFESACNDKQNQDDDSDSIAVDSEAEEEEEEEEEEEGGMDDDEYEEGNDAYYMYTSADDDDDEEWQE
jgi:ribosomal protein L12E/L44/L45/RPP1/RPP2